MQQWCNSDATVMQQWCSSDATVMQQWCNSDATVMQQWCNSQHTCTLGVYAGSVCINRNVYMCVSTNVLYISQTQIWFGVSMHANMHIYLRIFYTTYRMCRLDKLSGISGYLYWKTLASIGSDGIGDRRVSDSRRDGHVAWPHQFHCLLPHRPKHGPRWKPGKKCAPTLECAATLECTATFKCAATLECTATFKCAATLECVATLECAVTLEAYLRQHLSICPTRNLCIILAWEPACTSACDPESSGQRFPFKGGEASETN